MSYIGRMLKAFIIGVLILVGGIYVLGFFSEYSLRQVSIEEYTRTFIAQAERYVSEQVRSAQDAVGSITRTR